MEKIVLASGSPRRKELLARTGVVFSVVVSNGEENTNLTDPAETVEKLSQDKAISVADRLENESEPCLIIGADTVVAFEGKILGKPSDEEDALDTLLKLQGKSPSGLYRCNSSCKRTRVSGSLILSVKGPMLNFILFQEKSFWNI